MYRTDRRNILERTHARRPPPIARRKNGRTRILPADRIHRPTWHCLRKDEDRHTGTNRRTQHPLRFDGYTRRRMRLPQVLIHEYQYAPFEATAMLDLLYQRRSAPDSARRAAGFSLFNGQIQSIGPRYCPSIETKIVTFPDKEQHQLFLEPEGETTQELYLNGFSSSLPMDIQIAALKKSTGIQGYRHLSSRICD